MSKLKRARKLIGKTIYIGLWKDYPAKVVDICFKKSWMSEKETIHLKVVSPEGLIGFEEYRDKKHKFVE